MISLVDYILNECGEIFATPANTTGMGNPAMPGMNGEVGSGDTLPPVKKDSKKLNKTKKKRVQRIKDEK